MTTDPAVHGGEVFGRPRVRDLFYLPGYTRLLISSLLWHTTRWGELFAVGYLLTKLTDSPFTNQSAGALMFLPMLVGGFLAGAISDRIDRRKLIMVTQMILIPMSFVMFLLVQFEWVRVWMTFPFMFGVGVGGLVNMTAQRPFIYDKVGPALAPQAMSLETIAQATAGVIGTLVGGTLIQTLGMGASFAGMTVVLCGSAMIWMTVPSADSTPSAKKGAITLRDQLKDAGALVRGNRGFVAMLWITVIFNLFYSSFLLLVPVVAEEFDASAILTAVLSSATGIGQILASGFLSAFFVRHHSRVFAAGAGISMIGLGAFGGTPILLGGVAALLVAGFGQAAFGSRQAILAIEAAGSRAQGTALGVLSTAIGVTPIGMILLGVAAEGLGTRLALVCSSTIGLLGVVLIVWWDSDLAIHRTRGRSRRLQMPGQLPE